MRWFASVKFRPTVSHASSLGLLVTHEPLLGISKSPCMCKIDPIPPSTRVHTTKEDYIAIRPTASHGDILAIQDVLLQGQALEACRPASQACCTHIGHREVATCEAAAVDDGEAIGIGTVEVVMRAMVVPEGRLVHVRWCRLCEDAMSHSEGRSLNLGS